MAFVFNDFSVNGLFILVVNVRVSRIFVFVYLVVFGRDLMLLGNMVFTVHVNRGNRFLYFVVRVLLDRRSVVGGSFWVVPLLFRLDTVVLGSELRAI